MNELVALAKMVQSRDVDSLHIHNIDKSYFIDELQTYEELCEHVEQYNKLPDLGVFLDEHPIDVDLDNVTMDEAIDPLRESFYTNAVNTIYDNTEATIASTTLSSEDKLRAIQEMIGQINDIPFKSVVGYDYFKQAQDRHNKILEMKCSKEEPTLPTGFNEIDKITNGLKRGEELCVVLAKTNMGKSWVTQKIVTAISQQGFNVGYFTPEMSSTMTATREDTLMWNLPQDGLTRKQAELDVEQLGRATEKCGRMDRKFLITDTPDFGGKVTVPKLKQWAMRNKLDAIALDGIDYIDTDKRYYSKTERYGFVADELFDMSKELGIPVVLSCQANRTQFEEDTPEIDNVEYSSAISQKCTTMISINQKEFGELCMRVIKSRSGSKSKTIKYDWDINTGKFTFKGENPGENVSDSTPKQSEFKPRQRQAADDVDDYGF